MSSETREFVREDYTYSGSSGTINIEAFAEAHNLIPEFITLPKHQRDRVRCLNGVRRALNALPGTATHISRKRAAELAGYQSANGAGKYFPAEFFIIHGAYPCPADTMGGVDAASMKFANPRYEYPGELDSVTDDDERLAWLDRYASLGMNSQDEIAPHFGLASRSSVSDVVQRLDFNWREAHQEGLRRRARTWKLLDAWGYDRTTLAEAFGVSRPVVQKSMERYAPDFEPPDRPS